MTALTAVTAKDVLGDANRGIVGIDADLEIYEGYDASIGYANLNADPEVEFLTMTTAEKLALADAMIARWTAYREVLSRI